ncbi:MAG: NusA-like transcription termination signal-binding factor [Candidatus Aenigmarchaeota archaeon]|nr:NusA-like transcription termination signal-binding factor [Candidatus Aenigmarchaeota archaeon]
MKSFDMKTIGLINIFERVTKDNVIDCISDEKTILFLVEPGKAGSAIGRNGKNIKKLNKLFNKQVKIFEYNEDSKKFIKNLIPEAENIEIKGNKAYVTINSQDKGKIIGRNGYNIKKIREFLKRNSPIKSLEAR